MINFPEYTLESWLEELKPFQREDIKQLLQNNNNNLEVVAELYLYANGASNTVKFGGVNEVDRTFFTNLKTELRNFVCGDPEYNYHYEQIKKLIEPTRCKTAFLTAACSAISNKLEVSIAVIYPVITILLSLVASIGANAYCKLRLKN